MLLNGKQVLIYEPARWHEGIVFFFEVFSESIVGRTKSARFFKKKGFISKIQKKGRRLGIRSRARPTRGEAGKKDLQSKRQ